MSQTYLINKDKIAECEDISSNISPSRMLVFVKKAQELDLRPFMGKAFYDDFIKYFSNDESTGALVLAGDIPTVYRDLFAGKTYEDQSGHNIIYTGITTALVYWSFARFIEADSVRYTTTGPVQKHHDDADPLSQKDIGAIVIRKRSEGNSYANDIEQFLWNNKTDYPLWRFNERNKNSRQPGSRIRAVDRTDYNRAGYGYNDNGLGGFI